MELRHLKYFIKVADKLNFTEAAAELFVTQSTLSQQIKQLENELGVPLFDRLAKKVYLTEAGYEFLPYAVKTLRDAEFGKQRLLDLQDVRTGELKIGIIYSLINFLPPVIAAFHKKHPGIKFTIGYHQTNTLIAMLKERKYDMVMCYQPQRNDPMLDVELLYQSPLSVVMSKKHPLAIRKEIPLDLLSSFPLALPTTNFHARSVLDQLAADCHVELKPSVEMNGVLLLLQLASDGHWISVLSKAATYEHPDLVAVPLVEKGMMRASIITLKDTYEKKAMKEFKKLVLDHVKKEWAIRKME